MVVDETLDPMPAHLCRAGRNIILALLIVAPLLFLPPDGPLQNALDTLRRIALMLGAGLLTALTLSAWSLRRRLVLRRHVLDAGVVLLLFALIVSSIGGAYPHISLTAPVWMTEGLPFLGGLVLLYFGVKEFLREPEDRALAAFLLVAMGGVVAVIGLIERAVFDPAILPRLPEWVAALQFNPNFSGVRLIATLGNSMFTGTYFAMLIPLAVGVALSASSRARLVVALASLVLMAFALPFTLARAAWVGLAVVLPLLVLLVLWRAYSPAARREEEAPSPLFRTALLSLLSLLALTFVLGGMVIVRHQGLRDRLQSIGDMRQDGTVQTRAIYMRTSWNMFLARPVQGWGPGNLRYVFPQYRPYSIIKEMTLPLNRGYNTALPHNLFLQTAAETGLIGLFALLLLVFLLFRTAFPLVGIAPRYGWAVLGVLGLALIYYQVNFMAMEHATVAEKALQWLFWLIVFGGAAFATRAFRQEATPPRDPWLAIGLLGLLTVYLLVNQMAFDNSATMSAFWIGLALLAGITAGDRALAVRAGRPAPPLSPRAAHVAGMAGAVLLLLAPLHAITTTLAANQVQEGLRMVQRVLEPRNAEEANARPENARQASRHVRLAIALTPSPFFWVERPGGPEELRPGLHMSWTSNFALYDALFFAYRAERGVNRTLYRHAEEQGYTGELEQWRDQYHQASEQMYRAGETALRLMDHDPLALRYLLSEYSKDERYADGHRIAAQLIACEPMSSEIHLIYAGLLSLEESYAKAREHAERAIKLDPTFPEAYAMAGHYTYLDAMHQDGKDVERMQKIRHLLKTACAHFGKSLELGAGLRDEHRLEYTQALFWVKEHARAIEQGRLLQGTEEFEELCAQITEVYRRINLPEEGEGLLRALREGMPLPPEEAPHVVPTP